MTQPPPYPQSSYPQTPTQTPPPYDGQPPGHDAQPGYGAPAQPGHATQPGYAAPAGYGAQPGYAAPTQPGYAAQTGYGAQPRTGAIGYPQSPPGYPPAQGGYPQAEGGYPQVAAPFQAQHAQPAPYQPQTTLPLQYPPGPLTQCRVCGCVPAVQVTFRGHRGMVILMQYLTAKGPFCRDCGLATFRQMTSSTLVRGWYGYVSFGITPIVVISNAVKQRKVAELPAPMPSPYGQSRQPMDPGVPLMSRPQTIIGLGIPVILIFLLILFYAI
jgi:hypothetical protein